MKNLKLNIEKVISEIEGEVTCESVKEAVMAFESTYTFVNDIDEARTYFEECEIEGSVFERLNQRVTSNDYEIVVKEYYVDAGSVDYVYSVDVYER
jgi:hypothetical protein